MAKPTKSTKSTKPTKSSDDFIPEDAVNSGSAKYLNKFPQGDSKIRIISMPIFGWLEWVDKKPVRHEIDNEPEVTDEENKPKKFMACVVIDREDDDKVKIMELTQQSVIKAIRALSSNPDWGKPFSYDININKKGEDLKTRYTVTPSPKTSLPKNVIKAAQAEACNLESLFEGEDPWNVEGKDETEYFFK